jgi:CelD/BcsL family acetyltransferase involved in cellulose biosynthesis
MRGEAAIPRVAGEERTIAEIFHAGLAKTADAAGESEPGDSDAVTDPVRRDLWTKQVDTADDFMAGDNGIFDVRQLGVDNMEVGAAHPARAHLDTNFSVVGRGIRAFLHLQRRARRRQNHRAHIRFSMHGPVAISVSTISRKPARYLTSIKANPRRKIRRCGWRDIFDSARE